MSELLGLLLSNLDLNGGVSAVSTIAIVVMLFRQDRNVEKNTGIIKLILKKLFEHGIKIDASEVMEKHKKL